MPLDAEIQPVIDLVNAVGGPGPDEAGVQFLRDNFALMCAGFGPGPEAVDVTDIEVDGRGGAVPARVYRPDDDARAALVFFHGGGYVIGSIETHDALCRELAAGAGIVVVSVEYRLAPEHPYPAPLDDGQDALAAIAERADELGLDPARLAVGGDSAGGNLATVVAGRWAERRDTDPELPSLRFQLLYYPVCEFSGPAGRFPSLVENGSGYLLTAEVMDFFGRTYLTGTQVDPASADVSPINAAPSDLAELPPALIITAEYDPLRDEGEAYAARLAEAGVDVTVTRYDGAVHSLRPDGVVRSDRPSRHRAVDHCPAERPRPLTPCNPVTP